MEVELPGPLKPANVDMGQSDRELFCHQLQEEGWGDELEDVPRLPAQINLLCPVCGAVCGDLGFSKKL